MYALLKINDRTDKVPLDGRIVANTQNIIQQLIALNQLPTVCTLIMGITNCRGPFMMLKRLLEDAFIDYAYFMITKVFFFPIIRE